MHNFSMIRNTFSNLITWDLEIENKHAMILGPMKNHEATDSNFWINNDWLAMSLKSNLLEMKIMMADL